MGPGRSYALAAVLALLAACGQPADPAAPPQEPPVYAGPLHIVPGPSRQPWNDPGAAGRAVMCDQPVLGGNNAEPFRGGEVRETPTAALQEARDEGQYSGLDDNGMREVRREGDRILYTYVVDSRTLQAVVLHHGRVAPGSGAGPDGIAWYVESWARCDVVEYPERLAESRGVEVWTDPTGRRISSMVLASDTSDGSCLTRGLRTLRVDQGVSETAREYLAHAEEYPDATDEPFRTGLSLPSDAVDSGYQHEGEHLWFSPDQRRAYIGTSKRVDLWPRSNRAVGCG